MKYLIFCCALCIIFTMNFAHAKGQDTIARFKYADAEKAFINKNYRQSIRLLNETEALLGKPAPNVMHLRILATQEQLMAHFLESHEEFQKFHADCEYYLANYDIEGLEDKYRQVYDICEHNSGVWKMFANAGSFYLTKANRATTDAERFEATQKAADSGDSAHAEAQYNLARLYADGRGVAKDQAKAFILYKKAAEGEFASAQNQLGWNYEHGNGGAERDYETAFKWYSKAAEQKNTSAQANLARLYENGNGVPKDLVKAFAFYQRGAEAGDKSAQYDLARLYENGAGVAKDLEKAFAWYKRAADDGIFAGSGNESAQIKLIQFYLTGKGVATNKPEALALYDKIAANNKAQALSVAANLGSDYYYGLVGFEIDYTEAVMWYTKAVAANKSWYGQLANSYYRLDKFDEATKWYLLAAKSDSKYAPFFIALMQYEGKGAKTSYEQTLQWIEKSNYYGSKLSVAMMYYSGKGVTKDRNKAVELSQAVVVDNQNMNSKYLSFKKHIIDGGDLQKYYPKYSADMLNFLNYLDENYPEMFTDKSTK